VKRFFTSLLRGTMFLFLKKLGSCNILWTRTVRRRKDLSGKKEKRAYRVMQELLGKDAPKTPNEVIKS
jgi:hypothetical protein